MNLTNFLAELKRRNVYKVAVGYAVVAWLVMQVAATIVPALQMPDAIMTAVVVLALAGFPIALVIAWAFEMTPDGMKRTEDISPNDKIPQWSRRKFAVFVLGVALVAAGFLGYHLWRASSAARVATAGLPNEYKSPTTVIPERSIAVLPFENLSSDKDERYFSDGLSEDLITALSQLTGLKVIGRTSAFKFRESKDDSRTIGTKLGVAHLLEGSVRRAGDVIRISADLINAPDSSTLWSQRYDRPYKDIFKLQDEITEAVAAALKTKLLPEKKLDSQSDRPPSGNLEAYNAYLQGKFYASRQNGADANKAIESYNTAIRLDPQYAMAYAWQAFTWSYLAAAFEAGAGAQESFAKARAAAKLALSLAPNLSAAHLALGRVSSWGALDWVRAEAEFRRGQELEPTSNQARSLLAEVQLALGHPTEAAALLRQVSTTDTLDAAAWYWLSSALVPLGQLEAAEKAASKAIELRPSDEPAYAQLVLIQVARGDAAGALATALATPQGKWQNIGLAMARQVGSDRTAADAALQKLINQQADRAAFQIAEVQTLRGDPTHTFEWLDRAWTSRDPGLNGLLVDPFLLRYKDDPRFAAFCRKVGLPVPATNVTATAMPAK